MTVSFMKQLSEFGFAGPPHLLLPVVAAEFANRRAEFANRKVVWFQRQVIRNDRGDSRVRVWLKAIVEGEGNLVILSEISYLPPTE